MASKAEKQLARAERREARRQASAEVLAGRIRTAIGFGAAYVLTQALPAIVPGSEQYQATIDLLLFGGGAVVVIMDDGPIGDYALGASMVGATQTLDNVGVKLQEWFTRS